MSKYQNIAKHNKKLVYPMHKNSAYTSKVYSPGSFVQSYWYNIFFVPCWQIKNNKIFQASSLHDSITQWYNDDKNMTTNGLH